MKCKECNGVGYVKTISVGGVPCSVCNGTGEVQTNEEWFDGLSTEEKAKVFADATFSTAETPLTILWGGKEAEQKKWEMWLKQPHTKE